MSQLAQIAMGVVFSPDVLGVEWACKCRTTDGNAKLGVNTRSTDRRGQHAKAGDPSVVASMQSQMPLLCKIKMTDTLRLSAFALPTTFPPESVPDACADFIRECVPGLSKRQLLARTRARGWVPAWRPLTHIVCDGLEAFALDLTVDGTLVPVIAWMRRVGKDAQPVLVPKRDPRQLPLL
ncbi:hypothetical protein BamIOP4010DRAFT_6876 [Burkholderia ambifaria IOP40-10]|uniref:Uncharacterized protein n=1 Tax=Burkholderia ambifaria IOP40-10 TaxID=396596 RepID=B1FS63_9BURK|nr:hypothetical protein [Burkholderia ambifaria]EDS99608.1 hypothetical protein BamIOP4010DRAFT_6876 [Burkholderia ambifaria IOP40-10]